MQQTRVAIYCRVSTDDQNCDRQERDLLIYCEKLGYEVTNIFRETASGAKNDRQERKKVMALAQARKIDAIVVTEMSRWGRSTVDLIHTLHELEAKGVSLIAQNGFQFDLSTPHGKLVASIMASLAEFERDLIRERVKSGIAAALAKGRKIGRQKGQTIKTHKLMDKVIALSIQGVPQRKIAADLKLSTNTVNRMIRDHRASA